MVGLMEVEEICIKIRSLLKEAVLRNLSEGILLSGGLDTSILAYLASDINKLRAITVAFNATLAPDVEYAKLITKTLNLDHIVHLFDKNELFNSIPMVIKTLKSFDPMEIRNSVSIFIALKLAKEKGIKSVMTGDGSDELFAGYSFLFELNKEQLDDKLSKIWESMSFSSIPLSKALNIDVKIPFLDQELKSYAMNLDSKYKIKKEGHKTWGKWILRKAFDDILPKAIVWREKAPIEYGSGTNVLTSLLEKMVNDFEFEEKRKRYVEEDNVVIRSKEQLWYYEIYRSIIGIPKKARHNGKNCPFCHSDVNEYANYCRVCGAYPI
ncbi:MAG: asparagine synthase C-terminal domain-containing protein [Nitrososphaerales archaeon]